MFFKISQKVTRNYAYIGKKTYAKNFKKISQSGHTNIKLHFLEDLALNKFYHVIRQWLVI